MRNATCTAGVGVGAGDEEGKDSAGPAIGNTVVGCGDGGDCLLVKDRMNHEGRNGGPAEFSTGRVGP